MHRLQHVRDGVSGQGHRDRGSVRPRRPGPPEIPGAFRDRLLALHLLRLMRRGLPGGCDPHGQGSTGSADLRSSKHVVVAAGAPQLESAARCRETLSAEGRRAAEGGRMIEALLLWLFAGTALVAALLMLVLRHPMRVALALTATMLSLAGVYALLGVHVIAIFQVLIYVGAVMVFMVYAIMLLDVRDRSFTRRFSRLLLPGVAAAIA